MLPQCTAGRARPAPTTRPPPSRERLVGGYPAAPAARISVNTALGFSRSPSCSSAITCETALISARCVKACGKLPSCAPLSASISSANRPERRHVESTRAQSFRARFRSPISDRAETSQNEQIVNVPSLPVSPSSVSSTW